ncbi:hypothetical protein Q8A67_022959 [Cirrhinus molitorella]|uniref:Uncharacterized protein n=1 Tax=Cirrhinus molitorella TaxID=172907 RepID=A0AA88TCM0_9TELE|nr:hypothetical protein Q8A67_022959 [Cirrhinus molitorella]
MVTAPVKTAEQMESRTLCFYMVSEQGEAVKPGSFTRLSLIRHLTLSDRNGDKNPTAWKIHNGKCYDLLVNNPVVARRELHCEWNVSVFCRPQYQLVLFMDEEQAKRTIMEHFTQL